MTNLVILISYGLAEWFLSLLIGSTLCIKNYEPHLKQQKFENHFNVQIAFKIRVY